MSVFERLPRLEIPLFQCGFIYLCQNHQDWELAHEEMGSPAALMDRRGGSNAFRNLSGGQDIYILGIFDGSAATAAHEAAHIVFDICHSVGVSVECGKANETFCYLLDAIVEFAYQKLKGLQS